MAGGVGEDRVSTDSHYKSEACPHLLLFPPLPPSPAFENLNVKPCVCRCPHHTFNSASFAPFKSHYPHPLVCNREILPATEIQHREKERERDQRLDYMMEEGIGTGNVQFWLPPDFLEDGNDDLFLDGEEKAPSATTRNRCRLGASDSPGSNPESDDEEDYLAPGLTRQMTAAFLQDYGENPPAPECRKERTLSGSPQSILCDVGVWSSCSKGSPRGPSEESTPPSTPLEQIKDDALDLLSAAAGEVSRLQGRGILGFPAASKPTPPVPAASNYISGSTGFHSNLAVPQQLLMQPQRWNEQEYPAAWGRQSIRGHKGGGRTIGGMMSSSDWPTLQRQPQPPQPGSGMRAIFLTGKGTRRESTGTGVFLPRRPGNPTETRRKPACSVLLPDRVIHALNLNIDEMNANGLPGSRITSPAPKQMRERHRPSPSAGGPSHEPLQLPAEWTY